LPNLPSHIHELHRMEQHSVLPAHIHSSPSPVCAQALFHWKPYSSRRQQMHRSSRSTTYSYSRCVTCVCEHMYEVHSKKHFRLGQANTVQVLCIYTEVVKQLIIHMKLWKFLMVVYMLHEKHTLERGHLKGDLGVADIQHNWLEIVCCPAVNLSSVYEALKSYIRFLPLRIILWPFLHFEHNV